MFRHQLASYFFESEESLHPQMKRYLDANNLTYSSYVMGIYNGDIWADEFITSAISMMFNVCISIIRPYFIDIWHVYRDCHDKADIGLVCNRSHFGNGRHSISHFTATKGAES